MQAQRVYYINMVMRYMRRIAGLQYDSELLFYLLRFSSELILLKQILTKKVCFAANDCGSEGRNTRQVASVYRCQLHI